MNRLDAVTLAVLKGRLEQIADEMDATLFRTAFNPIIAEARDASHGLYGAETGETLVQGKAGLPIFVGAMAFAVKAVIEKSSRQGDLADGDVYIFNDPYDGGTTCPTSNWCVRSSGTARSSAGSPLSVTGMMSAEMSPATTIRLRPNAFRKEC